MPQRRITSAAVVPGCIASTTIMRFCSADQLRRRSPRVTTSTNSLRALGALPMPLPAFAEAAVAEEASMPPPPPLENSLRTPSRIEVVLPDGTVLRLDEDVGADALRRVIAVLRGR
jgi:hypothetical protein